MLNYLYFNAAVIVDGAHGKLSSGWLGRLTKHLPITSNLNQTETSIDDDLAGLASKTFQHERFPDVRWISYAKPAPTTATSNSSTAAMQPRPRAPTGVAKACRDEAVALWINQTDDNREWNYQAKVAQLQNSAGTSRVATSTTLASGPAFITATWVWLQVFAQACCSTASTGRRHWNSVELCATGTHPPNGWQSVSGWSCTSAILKGW